MIKKIVSLLLFSGIWLFPDSAVTGETQKLEVITTLFPTYDFAKEIGGDKVNVMLLLPPGIEAHSFDPKPADIVRINKADVFVYTGKFMEPWVEKILGGVTGKDLLIIDASTGITLMSDDEEPAHHEEEHGHHHGGDDPHIWLDLANAQAMANTIASGFAEKDPANKDFYLRNAKNYNLKLAALDEKFRKTFLTAKQRTIIYGGHFAFGYFMKRYGLEHESPYAGFSPNAEPSPKAIAELIDKMRASGIKYVYYEELLDPKVARIISQETGAKLELLHGAHNVSKDDMKKGITFIDIMEEDLKKLKVGLECQ
ncbi:MAG TPA: zinc ABC transporter substrate-binding protein [Candidatus Omnitrophota bacterium]|nr:zinc ABC transporter substrate-binding protein [Candidatus Omnitrophota bacterium]HPS20990.1 zinc ABC transporter substrate-binding protein [Candidatus Omnitrophota bacterium]